MSIQESQVPLPAPPTGVAIVIAEHEYNPENGHYEPSIRGLPLNANIASGTLAAPTTLLTVVANAPVWIYALVLANINAAVQNCVITEIGGNTYTIEIPANSTYFVTSNPDAPIFISRTAGIMTVGSTLVGTIDVTATYVIK